MDYQSEIEYIVKNTARNKFIKNLALSLKGNTLILFQYVEKHGKELYQKINDSTDKHTVHFIHGKVDGEDRELVRKIVELTDKNAIILEFPEYNIIMDKNFSVPLLDGTEKLAEYITEDDDVNVDIIINKIEASTSGIALWKNMK